VRPRWLCRDRRVSAEVRTEHSLTHSTYRCGVLPIEACYIAVGCLRHSPQGLSPLLVHLTQAEASGALQTVANQDKGTHAEQDNRPM
jgi:hypothetical protein